MPPAAIIGVGAAIGGVGAIASAKSNSKAATTAANTAQNTANQNNALAASIYSQNKETLSPYVQAGLPAMSALNGMLGLGTQAQNDNAQQGFRSYIGNSDYGFQFGNGSNALNSGYAAGGTLQSGAAMKALEQYRQNLQSGYRGEYMNALGNQQALGMGAASAQAGVATNYGNTVMANNNSAGTAAANAALIKGQNNPLASAAGLLGGTAFSYGLGKI